MEAIRAGHGLRCATPEIWAEVQATYYGITSRLDDQFGRIIQKIDTLGLWNSTMTMFFTDHGEYLGDYGLVRNSLRACLIA